MKRGYVNQRFKVSLSQIQGNFAVIRGVKGGDELSAAKSFSLLMQKFVIYPSSSRDQHWLYGKVLRATFIGGQGKLIFAPQDYQRHNLHDTITQLHVPHLHRI